MNSVSIAINDFKKQLCGVGIEIKLVLPYQNLFIALLRCNVPFFYFSFFSFFLFFNIFIRNMFPFEIELFDRIVILFFLMLCN